MKENVPQSTAAYVGARPRLRKALNAIFIAIATGIAAFATAAGTGILV